MKAVYLLLFIYECAIPMFDLHVMYMLVLKSIILVLCHWYQLKKCKLGKPIWFTQMMV